MKQLLLFISFIISIQCFGQQALSTMARSPYPNMMVTSNAQRYMRYQFASDFATTFGDSLPNLYNKSDTVTDGNRTVFLKQNGSLTISAKHEFELFPHSGLRILTKTGSDDDVATRALSVVGTNDDSIYISGGNDRFYFVTRQNLRTVSKGSEIKTDSTNLSMDGFYGNILYDFRASPKGLEYPMDYSATYNPLSLVTKTDLDNGLAGKTWLKPQLEAGNVSIINSNGALDILNTDQTSFSTRQASGFKGKMGVYNDQNVALMQEDSLDVTNYYGFKTDPALGNILKAKNGLPNRFYGSGGNVFYGAGQTGFYDTLSSVNFRAERTTTNNLGQGLNIFNWDFAGKRNGAYSTMARMTVTHTGDSTSRNASIDFLPSESGSFGGIVARFIGIGSEKFVGLGDYISSYSTTDAAEWHATTIVTNGAANSKDPFAVDGASKQVLLLVKYTGDIQTPYYPNSRNDAGNPVNVISTDGSGNLQSHPISELSNGITFLKDSRVYDFPSCPANSAIFVNFVITGAIQGASGTAGLDQNLGNECFLTVTVGASGFVSVALRNTGIVAFDAPSGTLKTVINNF